MSRATASPIPPRPTTPTVRECRLCTRAGDKTNRVREYSPTRISRSANAKPRSRVPAAKSTYSATSRALEAGTLDTNTSDRCAHAVATRSTPAPVTCTSSSWATRSSHVLSTGGPTAASTTARADASSVSATSPGLAAYRICRSAGGSTPTCRKSDSGRKQITSAFIGPPRKCLKARPGEFGRHGRQVGHWEEAHAHQFLPADVAGAMRLTRRHHHHIPRSQRPRPLGGDELATARQDQDDLLAAIMTVRPTDASRPIAGALRNGKGLRRDANSPHGHPVPAFGPGHQFHGSTPRQGQPSAGP